MKKLHVFILKTYLGSFAITFIIAVFIFLMFFVFAYVDDFIGKNIQFTTLIQLFFYISLTTVPKALPLAILLSCIMTVGNITEHFEIAAMKSAGISFFRITRPLLVFASCMALFILLFSNFILTRTNLKSETLLLSIRASKPALLFKEGVFNNSLKGYSIRVGKVNPDNQQLEDILIYDHTEFKGNTTVIHAKTGLLKEMNESGLLFFTLKNGSSYKEMTDSAGVVKSNTFIRDKFEQRVIRFDLSGFLFKQLDENDFRDGFKVLDMKQLSLFVDSLEQANRIIEVALKNLSHGIISDTLNKKWTKQDLNSRKAELIDDKETNESRILKYSIEWHKRITSAFSCILFFLIGTPLGYIIKKGGLGLPVVVSILLFILFHTVSLIGEQLAEDTSLTVHQGTWLPFFLLVPVGMFLFYRALMDHPIFNRN